MTILYGLNQEGSISSGTAVVTNRGPRMTTTGADCPGTRDNNGEDDDGCAGGPSWDQILLKNVPDLQRPGTRLRGTRSAMPRVDSLENLDAVPVSRLCDTLDSVGASGWHDHGEHPALADAEPGAALHEPVLGLLCRAAIRPEIRTRCCGPWRARKSVLDLAPGQLSTSQTLAPGSEKAKIDFHAEAIRKIEISCSPQIDMGGTVSGCMLPMAPDPDLRGKTGPEVRLQR